MIENLTKAAARPLHLAAAALLLAAACTTSSDDGAGPGTGDTESTTGELTASARGVTADTIRIGFSYPDLDALAESGLVKVSHGPYGEIVDALVDDINAQGGVNGRKLEVSIEKFSVLTAEEQLAACAKLTEDDEVFAVLGGFIGDNNLCVAQQHSTTLISGYGSGFNSVELAKARAPWVTWNASDDRAIEALVRVLDDQGRLEGKTIGVYGALASSEPLIDLTVTALEAAGYTVEETAINDAPATDGQAASSQDEVIAARFQDQGIDLVIVLIGYPPGANFDAADYHPEFYSPQTGSTAAGAFTNPYGEFPLVAGLSASGDPDEGYDTPEMQRCRDVWKRASGRDIKPASEELRDGESSGFTAMLTACTSLRIFVEAAEAAGPNLTPETWMQGLESLGTIALPSVPAASFGPGKPDGQDTFQLAVFNPEWTPDSDVPQFLPEGDPITFTG
jgi:ABC-type branched-subunit amino acid transport system substrate-binding protein